MPGPKPIPITVTEAQLQALRTLVNKQTEEQILVTRAWIILMAHLGHSTRQIARYRHVSEDSVSRWKARWRECATTGLGETEVRRWLSDAPKPGKPPTITAEQWCQIMALACENPQDCGRPISHWTVREVADEAIKRGIVDTISQRHLGRFFKRSQSQTASDTLLAHPAAEPRAGSHHPSSLSNL